MHDGELCATACIPQQVHDIPADLELTFQGLDGEFLPIWGRFVVALQHDGLNQVSLL
jgi:hypothetical protein